MQHLKSNININIIERTVSYFRFEETNNHLYVDENMNIFLLI